MHIFSNCERYMFEFDVNVTYIIFVHRANGLTVLLGYCIRFSFVQKVMTCSIICIIFCCP
jgi:hypothetical protein